jgi:hypothetical protein
MALFGLDFRPFRKINLIRRIVKSTTAEVKVEFEFEV